MRINLDLARESIAMQAVGVPDWQDRVFNSRKFVIPNQPAKPSAPHELHPQCNQRRREIDQHHRHPTGTRATATKKLTSGRSAATTFGTSRPIPLVDWSSQPQRISGCGTRLSMWL